MRVFVTGASGAIGRRVVPLFFAAGHHVTAVGCTAEKREVLEQQGAAAVRVDLFDTCSSPRGGRARCGDQSRHAHSVGASPYAR